MTEILETTVDKFIFKVAADRQYNDEGVWAMSEGELIRIGISDFVQQRNGDVAFAEVKPEGTKIALGDEVAVIETIKVDIAFSSPLTGTIVEVNPAMEEAPEAINKDPYGQGWLALIEPSAWEDERSQLLDAQAYFERMKIEAEKETEEL
jgi:glycine cleavage system H protein